MHNDIRTLKSTPAKSDPQEAHDPLQAFPEAVKPIQIDGQCFKHAFHARLGNRRLEPPGTEDTAFLARAVSAWLAPVLSIPKPTHSSQAQKR